MKLRVTLALAVSSLVACGGDDPTVDESLLVVNVSEYLEVFNPSGPSRIVVTLPGTVAFRLTQLAAVGANYQSQSCAGYLPGRAPAPGAADAAGFVGYVLVVQVPNPLHRAAAQAIGFEQMSPTKQQALSASRPCADLGLS
jgi:hypothetical protein